jgi:hypothetical protein
MKINTDIEKIINPSSEVAKYYIEQGYQLAQKETAEKVEKLKEELFYGDYLHFNNAEKKVISNVFNKIFNEDKK